MDNSASDSAPATSPAFLRNGSTSQCQNSARQFQMLGVSPSPLASWTGFQAVAEGVDQVAERCKEIHAAWLSSASQGTLGHPRCATLEG